MAGKNLLLFPSDDGQKTISHGYNNSITMDRQQQQHGEPSGVARHKLILFGSM